MLLGLGLMAGSIEALVSPGKRDDFPDEDKPRDWPVIIGLLLDQV